MASSKLAKRTYMDQTQLLRIEGAEPEGEATMATMQRIAEGMNMKFSSGFALEKNLETLVRQQAKKVALKRCERRNKTMSLKLQGLDSEIKGLFRYDRQRLKIKT